MRKARRVNSPGRASRTEGRAESESEPRRSVAEEEGEDALDAHGTAVAVDLDDVFGRVAARGEHRKEEDLVDDLVVVADGAVDGHVGSKGVAARGGVALVARRGAEHRARGGDGVGARETDDGDAAGLGDHGGGDGGDGGAVVVAIRRVRHERVRELGAPDAGARGGRERDAARAEDETRAGDATRVVARGESTA